MGSIPWGRFIDTSHSQEPEQGNRHNDPLIIVIEMRGQIGLSNPRRLISSNLGNNGFLNQPIQLGPLKIDLGPLRGSRLGLAAASEPELSRRLINLVLENWIAFCDLPEEEQPPFSDHPIGLYMPQPGSSEARKLSIAPEKLASKLDRALLAPAFLPSFKLLLFCPEDSASGSTSQVQQQCDWQRKLIEAISSEMNAHE